MWTAWVEFYIRFSATFTLKPLSTQNEPFNENLMMKKPTIALMNERKLYIFQMRTLEQRFILAYKFFRVDPCTVAINWQPNRFTHRRTNDRYIFTYTDVYKWNIGYFAIASLVWMKFSMKMGYTKRSSLSARVGFQCYAVLFESVVYSILKHFNCCIDKNEKLFKNSMITATEKRTRWICVFFYSQPNRMAWNQHSLIKLAEHCSIGCAFNGVHWIIHVIFNYLFARTCDFHAIQT